MPPPRPPSRIEIISTPQFGMCWYGNPGDGTSIIAYCGGGGSAATGVKNFITVRFPGEDPIVIGTGEHVGVGIAIVQNPMTSNMHLFVALGTQVVRYSLPDAEKTGHIEVGENLNAIAVNAMVDHLAVGCESGAIKIYKIADDKLGDSPVFSCEGHVKTVCSLVFSLRENILVSSAKDGTARVWQNGKEVATLTCSVKDPKAPPPKRVPQVLVRGCAIGDLNGQLIYTVASGRRGKAYLSQWGMTPEKKYECLERTECSTCPISSMSLSGDAGRIALGSVDGSIIIWSVERWRPLKIFREVHDLPVTCVAARPFPVPLLGEENGIQIDALSASADSKLAWLTLQRKAPKKKQGGSLKGSINSLVRMALLLWALSPVWNEAWAKCEDRWDKEGYGKAWECLLHDVLIAPSSKPGILIPPH